jgi:hypothetical protein
LSLIITDNQAFFTTSLPTSPILTMIYRTKQENVEEKKAAKAAVAHRNEDQHHRRRTQSVLTRRPPHPAHLTGALKQKLPTLIWLKGQQWML